MMESLILTLGNIVANGINITMNGDGKVYFDLDVNPAVVTATPDSASGTLSARPVARTSDGSVWKGDEVTLFYLWGNPGDSGLPSYPAPKIGDLGIIIKSKYFLPYSSGASTGGIEDAPRDGKTYARRDGSWVEVTFAEPDVGVMYYGYIEGINSIEDITADMIESDTVVAVQTTVTPKIPVNAPRGSVIFALIPADSKLSVRKDDGIDGLVDFSEDIHRLGTGANGMDFEIDGKAYKLYGELNLVDAITYIHVI